MTAFSLLPDASRHLLAELFFLAVVAQLALCLYQQLCRCARVRRICDWALLVLLLCFCAHTLAALGGKITSGVPWPLLPMAAALTFVHVARGIHRAYRESRETLHPSSIKEAIDNLDSGLLFSDAAGKTVLINRTMGTLASELIGAYPQMREELAAALAEPSAESGVGKLEGDLYRFPDGRIWRIRSVPLSAPELSGFTQTTAQDMTELAAINDRLARDNETLRETITKMQKMVERIVDFIPRQEMLSLKIRIHNDIGASLIVLSELVQNGAQEEADAQIRALSNALRYFGRPDAAVSGTFEAARRQAAEMKVSLLFDGEAPQSAETEALIAAAASECVTNCVRHAGGSAVTVTVTAHAGICTATITNDGKAPDGPIAEGGGLSSLRKQVESVGGEMHISHTPRFTLILNLTERSPEL